jgi:hypothetical protein
MPNLRDDEVRSRVVSVRVTPTMEREMERQMAEYRLSRSQYLGMVMAWGVRCLGDWYEIMRPVYHREYEELEREQLQKVKGSAGNPRGSGRRRK